MSNSHSLEEKVRLLEDEVRKIHERNARVEADKAWETSRLRKLGIVLLTYFVMCTVMYSINIKDFYINAIIPTLGFFLSTLSLSFLSKIWKQR